MARAENGDGDGGRKRKRAEKSSIGLHTDKFLFDRKETFTVYTYILYPYTRIVFFEIGAKFIFDKILVNDI